jgi:hypothetical protein
MVLPTTIVKGIQKNGIVWAIEHVFIWCIVYEQCVPNVSIRINGK